MAEERLIDDDKDRKFKIIINEDGEEEVVAVEHEPKEESPQFTLYEDEDMAELSPEQAEALAKKKDEELKARQEKFSALLESGEKFLSEGDFESANYAITQAEELFEEGGKLYFLKFKIATRNLNEFLNLEQCAEIAEKVNKYCDAEQKKQLAQKLDKLKSLIKEYKEKTENLAQINQKGKDERRGLFLKERKKGILIFTLNAIPFITFLTLAIVFASIMFADENGTYLILTIVFAALTLVCLLATAVGTRKLLEGIRDVRLNESDSSTKVGREYKESKNRLDLLERIQSAIEL